jgi:hypothetical protein
MATFVAAADLCRLACCIDRKAGSLRQALGKDDIMKFNEPGPPHRTGRSPEASVCRKTGTQELDERQT